VTNFVATEIRTVTEKPWPADEGSWNWLIKSMLFVGRHDRALALCEKLPYRSPWQELVRFALQAHSEQRVLDAISYWLQCAALDPNWYFPHYELAHAYQAAGQFENALAHAHKAVLLHPPFHSLWHELPMRVVIMASLRSQGDLTAARTELEALEERGLVEFVPELLIEAAAQHCCFYDQLKAAERCLEKALEQLTLYPVDQLGDSHILERALTQYVDLAGKYAEAGDLARSTARLARILDIVRSDATVQNRLCVQLGELGEKREMAADYLFADKCYTAAIQADPTAHWFRYRLSCMALKQRKLRRAFGDLFTLAGIPNAPRAVIEKILPPRSTIRLAPYWPASPRTIVKPLLLWLFMIGWFAARAASPGLRDFHTSITAVFLVWIFVARHFVRRLRRFSKIRSLVYKALRRQTAM
jgi:tetratricopeptide (TPR) repeat protein